MKVTPKPWTFESAGGVVPWKEGLGLPRRFQVLVEDDAVPYDIELEVLVEDGRPSCEGLRLARRGDGDPIASRELRSVRVTRYLAAAAVVCAVRFERLPDGSTAIEPTIGDEIVVERTDVEPRRRGRPKVTDAHLQEVARIYREGGRTPLMAVEAHWPDKSRSTVSRWIALARDKGLIDDEKGRA